MKSDSRVKLMFALRTFARAKKSGKSRRLDRQGKLLWKIGCLTIGDDFVEATLFEAFSRTYL